MASLFVIQGRDQGKRFELDAPAYSVGRESSNAIQLHDTEVSRYHVELREEKNSYSIIDLDSANGTFVNSNRTQHRVLENGDRVQLGRTLMIFTGSGDSHVEDLTDVVDIIGKNLPSDQSRIIKSISQEEGSRIFSGFDGQQSPWLARARSNLQVMYRTALAVSHTLDIDQLLQRILELIFEWVETDRGCVMLVDEETEELIPKARRTKSGISEDEKINISRTILDYVMQHKEGVLTSDARQDERWDPEGSIVQTGIREAICVPMQGRYGIVGVIYIDTFTPPGHIAQGHKANKFTEEHLQLMVAIGHQAALAVEDTSYYSALVQAELLAAVGQTIATLSHHIKNILQGIRGGSYLIEEGLKSQEFDVIQKGWNIVDKNQEKISNLVMDMLTFSKEREPDPTPADLNQVTSDVIELAQSRAEELKVELCWTPATEMPIICFDTDNLHRAILNVITNALDACLEVDDPLVNVSTSYSSEEKLACIVIRDNGSGIEPADIKKIFTVFESRKGGRGTGLGLPVSQKILREHGGEILVETERGKGSCFTLQLPAIPQEEPKSGTPEN